MATPQMQRSRQSLALFFSRDMQNAKKLRCRFDLEVFAADQNTREACKFSI